MRIHAPRSLLLLLALTACSSAAAIGADIAKEAPLVCPEFSFIPAGAQVCSTIALAVEGFFEVWATTHPASATAAAVTAAKARKAAVAAGAAPAPAALVKMVRVGNLGAFPEAIAAEDVLALGIDAGMNQQRAVAHVWAKNGALAKKSDRARRPRRHQACNRITTGNIATVGFASMAAANHPSARHRLSAGARAEPVSRSS